MIRGLYTAATGMVTQAKILDTVSNNLANADSTGFKKDTLVTNSFKAELTKRIETRNNGDIGSMNQGVMLDHTYTDFTQGNLKQTDGKLDLGIKGTGFFVIATTDKNGNSAQRYTRNGSFVLDPQNKLVTSDGETVLGENNSPIYINNKESAIIDTDGTISIDGKKSSKIKLVDFEDRKQLTKMGNALYEASDKAVEKSFTGEAIQGYVETSNVNTIKEMVEMINLSRNYETNQKVIQIHDQLLQRSVNDIGKL